MLLFERVDLEWDDAYCVPVATKGTSPEPISERREEPSAEPPVAALIEPPRRPEFRIAITLGIALLVLAVALALRPDDDLSRVARTVISEMTAARQASDEEKYALARRHLAEATRLADWVGLVEAMAECVRIEADMLAAEGKLESAVDRYEQALPLWRSFDRPHGLGTLPEVLAVNQARLGRLDEADRNLRESLAVLEGAGLKDDAAGTMRSLGSLAAVRGDLPTARAWYANASKAIAHRPDEAMHIDLLALNALLQSEEGRHEEALRSLRPCLAQWEKRGHRRWTAATLLQIAAVEFRAGQDDRAMAALRRAKKLFENVMDQKGLAECDALLELGANALAVSTRRTELFL